MVTYKQLSLADIFSDCQEKFDNDKPAFLSLLETHINIDEIIPISFRNHFYASTGRTRKYPLQAFLWALIIQRIFSIPTDQLLLTFLAYSKPLREFCGFTKVPDASKTTHFKQDFLDDLLLVFDNLVDITEPICQSIDSAKAQGFPYAQFRMFLPVFHCIFLNSSVYCAAMIHSSICSLLYIYVKNSSRSTCAIYIPAPDCLYIVTDFKK